ncbi:MAG: HEAT repeat domain-containing protein [Chloroflexi bacterium]|nr:HEAT repeat domain-containing protein [Chloroflexota bacterium]
MPQKPSFQTVLDSLLDSKKPISQAHLRLYSDLDPASVKLFLNVWQNVPLKRKLSLLDNLVEHFDEDTLVSYEDVGKALLDDPEAEVRARALSLLVESEDQKLVGKVVDIFLTDVETAPRMAALNVLGEFLLLGEYEKINEALERRIEDALITVIRSEGNAELRRHSLEILGFSSREEIPLLIESAFERVDPAWVACALRAMGHSQDERWNGDVVDKLLDEEPLVKSAAIEAAGMLAIQESVPLLIQILDDEETEEDSVAAAIWSLSQIGGDDARTYLVGLADQTDDEELSEYLEEAIENLDFMEDLNNFELFSLEDDDLLEEDEEEGDENK